MDKKKYCLAFMIALTVALSLSAVSTYFSRLSVIAAPYKSTAQLESDGELNADGYTLTWYTVDGGGGTGSGGNYELSYTIGQPDASTPAGDSTVVHGGYWPGVFQNWLSVLPVIGK